MSRISKALARAAGEPQVEVAYGSGQAAFAPEPGVPEAPGAFPDVAARSTVQQERGPSAEPAAPRPDGPPLRWTPERAARALQKKLAFVGMDDHLLEQYRRVTAMLHLSQQADGTRLVMVASALPGEGKTLTAANIALTLSESYGRRVLLVDADLRRPTLHTVFDVPNVSGLSDGLRSAQGRRLSVLQLSPRFTLLPAGKPMVDPMSSLTSPRMRELLEEARGRFDWVLLDTPPVDLMPDARLLAGMVDCAILVVQAGHTQHAPVKRAIDALGRERILGVVLNRAEQSREMSNYRDYDQAYAAASSARGSAKASDVAQKY